MPYTSEKPGATPDPDELRARIPGWGSDLDPANRPAFPREQPDIVTGAHWDLPEQQPGGASRERSVEHERLTPVFGTAQPLHGVAGRIRRFAYDRYSEGQTAHWMLLILGDRVDAITAHVASLVSKRPDEPFTQSGVTGEVAHHPIASRFGRGRIDLKHSWLDPLLVVGPWVLAAFAVFKLGRAIMLPASKRHR
ncbi:MULTISPECIES: hypothetical protein [unclassified Microbacterium]|uniref:hypothetical protein n=1 Tax=unclassified Microbacterium TaxID=2609290 RepID=UPI00214B27AC|nr:MULTISPECIES: hypothetical protein [unclassified Microbacterium]MCR2783897.1 hypothetical protein [Microbacterium sp. zg.B96]WIM15258.1 hypothetical protein QNO11_11995 [Microbacterium sp. zg-B96]